MITALDTVPSVAAPRFGARRLAVATLVLLTSSCGPTTPRESVPLVALAPWAASLLEQPTEVECLIFDTRASVTFDPIQSVRGRDIQRRAEVPVGLWSAKVFDHGWKGLPGVDSEGPVPDRALRVRRGESELLLIGSRDGETVEVEGGLDRRVTAKASAPFRAWWTSLRWP